MFQIILMRIRDKDFIDDRKEVTLDHEAEAPAFEYHDRIAAMSDATLRTAYLASDGCPAFRGSMLLPKRVRNEASTLNNRYEIAGVLGVAILGIATGHVPYAVGWLAVWGIVWWRR